MDFVHLEPRLIKVVGLCRNRARDSFLEIESQGDKKLIFMKIVVVAEKEQQRLECDFMKIFWHFF